MWYFMAANCDEFPELALVARGSKPAAKLEDLDPNAAARAVAVAQAWGLVTSVLDQSGTPRLVERDLALQFSGEPVTLFASSECLLVETLVEADRRQRMGGPLRKPSIEISGHLLGYPECCRRFFADLPTQDDGAVLGAYIHSGQATRCERIVVQDAPDPYLNFFPPLVSPVTWFPCSFTCSVSSEQAAEVVDAIREGRLGELSRSIRTEYLEGLTLAFRRFLFVQLLACELKDGWYEYGYVADALCYTRQESLLQSEAVQAFRREVTSVFSSFRRFRVVEDGIVLQDAAGAELGGMLREPALLLRSGPKVMVGE